MAAIWRECLTRHKKAHDTHTKNLADLRYPLQPRHAGETGVRPADYQEQIIRNWLRLVHQDDLVYHLGDVIFAKAGTLGEILRSLPGRKILIRGNHDRESNSWYIRHGFDFVAHGVLTGGVWLTHAPQATLPDGAIVNVHGHLHAGTHRSQTTADHCKLLALEVDGYSPVELDEFVGFSSMQRKILMPYEAD